MRRWILTLAALAAATGAPLAADVAQAQGRYQGRENGGWERMQNRPNGRVPPGQARREAPAPRRAPGPGPGPRMERQPVPGYPEARAYRPGGYLPPAYRDAPLNDYGRYRLRPPPAGYMWVRVPGAFLLVSRYDGQVFDVIPD